ncbi:hypothetical protein AF335_28410 [Streptomyces eurocidicus]|uniref:Uncharacterized protein n=1 Tax=Streptomyces eurocidicus TaxID=66423 RepID=A0A2N8NPM4_STREU|nr:hypothetical protein [Streptomyces eurocidicus]MBB5119553.1 hypothetical protein [Streptomyces eurocidicus]MBF6050590.1 hypothetical protein [Streptomyces eurocidicus]PNE30706.1 hypothetical protein AF335_28410 [Streptomyces eurocidicus]
MNRRTRIRTALATTFPTALTLPVCWLLAASGLVPWNLLLALPIALVVHAAVSYTRLPAGPGRPSAGEAAGRGEGRS